jgi:hypothetical protein
MVLFDVIAIVWPMRPDNNRRQVWLVQTELKNEVGSWHSGLLGLS